MAAVHIHTHTAFFRHPKAAGRLSKLERLPAAGEGHPWPEGAVLEARLHVYRDNRGTCYVGKLEVVTIPEPLLTPYWSMDPPDVAEGSVSTDMLRLLPLGALTREAVSSAPNPATVLQGASTYQHAASDYQHLDKSAAKATRGRPALLTHAFLVAVAEAYKRNAAHAPVQAVQQALAGAGFPGSGMDGKVTWDQAAKAVTRARRLGYIEPSQKTKKGSAA